MDENMPLTKKERREMRRKHKEEERSNNIKAKKNKKILHLFIWIALISGFVAMIIWKSSSSEVLGQSITSLGNDHIESVSTGHIPYNSTPPTSGPHLDNIAPWGVSKEPIPNELQVHNLEDGGVMVQYWCGGGFDFPENSVAESNSTSTAEVIADYQKGCPELVSQLKEIVDRYGEQVLLAPYPELPAKIALTAWTRIDTFDEFDEKRIVNFIEAYRGIDHHVR